LLERRIDVVVGLGGYASAAAVLAARTAGIPVVILEQNRDPGMSNRVFARLAAAVCTSFEETAESIAPGRAHWTGNPVRPELDSRIEASAARNTLLVFGGSGGAAGVNAAVVCSIVEIVRANSAELPPRIVHQTGPAELERVRERYAEAGVDVDVRAFIEDMAPEYRCARLVVCRSGATTVAELIATGSPSILIPFPFATGDHQTANARALERVGAAVLIGDDSGTAARLTETLVQLLNGPKTIDSMSVAATTLERPGAAQRVVDVLQSVLRAAPQPPERKES
jgi:UDP-N-acetylglucosamine--N-acetylmuramyl-(pentapeptide) pyrophosphoryl-undecaprenol N-acetylglucosamine transferase